MKACFRSAPARCSSSGTRNDNTSTAAWRTGGGMGALSRARRPHDLLKIGKQRRKPRLPRRCSPDCFGHRLLGRDSANRRLHLARCRRRCARWRLAQHCRLRRRSWRRRCGVPAVDCSALWGDGRPLPRRRTRDHHRFADRRAAGKIWRRSSAPRDSADGRRIGIDREPCVRPCALHGQRDGAAGRERHAGAHVDRRLRKLQAEDIALDQFENQRLDDLPGLQRRSRRSERAREREAGRQMDRVHEAFLARWTSRPV